MFFPNTYLHYLHKLHQETKKINFNLLAMWNLQATTHKVVETNVRKVYSRLIWHLNTPVQMMHAEVEAQKIVDCWIVGNFLNNTKLTNLLVSVVFDVLEYVTCNA